MILSILNSSAPLILAAMGGLLTERAGILNIALEGMILGGSFAALLAFNLTGSSLIGVLAALVAGTLIAMLFNLGTFTLQGNPFISGLGINILVPAVITSVTQRLFGNQGIIRPERAPHLVQPGGVDIFIWISLLVIILMLILFYRTRQGLMIRSCGDHTELLISRGISPIRIKKITVLLSGMLAATAGAALSLRLGVFVPGMSAGKGWIALVAIYLGYRKVPGISVACLFFALAEWGANRAQGSMGIPPGLILSFPYFMTLAGLLIFSIRKKKQITNK